jgi:hypothetical protein
LERAARAAELETDKALEAARKRGASEQELDEIAQGCDEGVLLRRYHEALSSYLLSKAHRLIVPVPDFENKAVWSWNADLEEHSLTSQGINELRAAIRAEEKFRKERFLMWVPAIGAVTGLVGTVTGLIAVWLK